MKRYLMIINLLLISVTAYFGVSLFYLIALSQFDSHPGSMPSAPMEKFSNNDLPPPVSFYKPITDRDLFQTRFAESKISKTLQVDKLRPTALNLKLWGTAIFGAGKGFAIIEDPVTRHQSLYTLGQTLQNATLKMILKDKVILSVDGKDEVLSIEEVKPQSQGMRIVSTAPEPVHLPSDHKVTLSRSQIEGAVQNLSELMTQINIRPHFLNGQPEGLAVGGIAPDSIFSKMGIRNGDIITGVDGKRIESVDDALKLYESIKSSKNVAIEIKRLGKTEVISYQVE
ncbi:MAG: type II secretion system protein N [Thermodesulfobacteriota bacterium]